jgi:hypothetical protein
MPRAVVAPSRENPAGSRTFHDPKGLSVLQQHVEFFDRWAANPAMLRLLMSLDRQLTALDRANFIADNTGRSLLKKLVARLIISSKRTGRRTQSVLHTGLFEVDERKSLDLLSAVQTTCLNGR